MSMILKCKCGKQLSVKQESAGKKGKCPGCGSLFTIPTPSKPTSSPAAREDDPFHLPFSEATKPAPPMRNSNLIKCTDCGKQISIRAASCPHCGSPRQSESANHSPGLSNAFANLELGLPPSALSNSIDVDPNRYMPAPNRKQTKPKEPQRKSTSFPVVMIILGIVLFFVSGAVIANGTREVELVQGAIRSGDVEAAGRLASNAYDAQQRMGIAGIVGLVGIVSFIAGFYFLVRVSSNPTQQRSSSSSTQTPSKATAIILALFFGGLGIHLFYVGRKNEGLVFLLLFLLLGPTVIIPLILVILSVVHIFQFAALDDASWEEQYGW